MELDDDDCYDDGGEDYESLDFKDEGDICCEMDEEEDTGFVPQGFYIKS